MGLHHRLKAKGAVIRDLDSEEIVVRLCDTADYGR